LAAALLAGCGADRGPEAPGPAELDWPAAQLRPGGELEADLDRGETHRYHLPLAAGQFLRVRVEQDGVDVAVRFEDPEGRLVLSADRPTGAHGPAEEVLALAGRSGGHALLVRASLSHGPGRYRAWIVALRPATERDRRAARTYRRYREAQDYARKERARAAAVWADALATWQELDEPALAADVLARMGQDHVDAGEWAAAEARYGEALAIVRRIGERAWEPTLRNNLGAAAKVLGEYDRAIEHYRAAAALAREDGDAWGQADVLYGLGSLYQAEGEIQQALSHYEEALAIAPEEAFDTRALCLHNLATLYRLHFQDPERARELLNAARDLYRPGEIPTHAAWKARSLRQLALLAQEAGSFAEARGDLEEALGLWSGSDPCGRATALATLATLEEQGGASRAADARMAEAFEAVESAACARSVATVHLLAGALAELRERPADALASYRLARNVAARYGDRSRLVDALGAIARTERAVGHLPKALAASSQALAILEEVRPTVLREDLRTAYFATAQDAFDLHVGLLLAEGAETEAWAAAERARAQSLRDLLAESGAGLRRRADPALVAQEGTLRRRLNVLEKQRLSAAEGDAERFRKLQREVDALVADVERTRGEIRRQSPAYAGVTATEPLSLAGVQRDLLDPDTLLLEYRLGTEASWLWAITRDSFASFRLPPRAEIERTAGEAARWAQSLRWPGHSPPPMCELTRSILAPAAALLGHRRLVVVADGALESVPFAALPDLSASCRDAPPLVAGHEIVLLPSVAALAAQRRLLAHRAPAPAWLAMVADPAYGPHGRFARLPYAGQEAATVLAELPPGRTFTATGAGASRAVVLGGELSGHRIVHFATHGVLNAEQPLLSYLALSEVAADGEAEDGALYAHEIYDLELPAELVVLSACETARGRRVRGEGVVSGLPRAFLYAGAQRVLVSLWPVPDRGTRDLMARFYRGLVAGGLPPGRALQEAQRGLWREGRPPAQWAGFVLLGDWRPLPPFDP
jgi:CHAT domain-containing protein